MSKVLKERVVETERLTEQIYRLTIESGYIAANATPGQFVNIKCCEGINALLRRPVSICSTNRKRNTFDIVFQVKGTGTELLSAKKEGNEIDLIGPLGKGFDISKEYGRIAVIGGGIGIFPLLFLLKEMKHSESSAFMGFRNRDSIVLSDEFKKYSGQYLISTDDGSVGYGGFVTDLLESALKEKDYDIIYSCGPLPMLKKVAGIAGRNGVLCQVSLEQRMGCGIGACLVCACKTKEGDGWKYSHVCKDGPVFWSTDVVFED